MIGWIIFHWFEFFHHRPKITRADVERQRVIDNTPEWTDKQLERIMRDITDEPTETEMSYEFVGNLVKAGADVEGLLKNGVDLTAFTQNPFTGKRTK
jgi:hypothetical protein